MKKGFTTIELIFALCILSLTISFFSLYQYRIKEIEKASILIQQTKNYVKAFNTYIKQEYKLLKQNVNYDTPSIISIDNIIKTIKVKLPMTNILSQSPCFNIIKDKNTGNFEGIMYYVSEKPKKYDRTLPFMNKVFANLGETSGVYYSSENIVKPIKYFWQINSKSPLLSNLNTCKPNYNIVDNSIVVNLSLIPEFNRILFPYNSINKETDNIVDTKLGDIENKNTSLTNLAFGNDKNYNINFAPDANHDKSQANNIILEIDQRDKNKVDLKRGMLFVSTLQANTYKASGDACSIDEVGQVAQQKDDFKTGLLQSILMCSYNPLSCDVDRGKGNIGDYCFLPARVNEIVFRNGPNNKMSNKFVCPAQMPYAKEVKAWYKPKNKVLEYRDRYRTGTFPEHVLFCKDTIYEEWCNEYVDDDSFFCSNDLGMTDMCAIKLSGIDLRYPYRSLDTPSEQFTPRPILKTANSQTLIIGYEFNNNSYEENCNKLCTIIPSYSDGKNYYTDYISMKYPENYYYWGRKFCLCRPRQIDGEGYNAIVVLPSVEVQPRFDYVICSSKMLIDSN